MVAKIRVQRRSSHAPMLAKLVAHASRQRFGDRQQERFRRSSAPHRLRFQAIAGAVVALRDLAKPLRSYL
jgi:hypothetical protein